MSKKLILAGAGLLLWVVPAQSAELAVSFSDKTAQLAVRQQVNETAGGRSILSARALYNDSEDTELMSVSYDVLGPLGNTGLEVGVGVTGYYVNGDNDGEIGAAGISGLVRFVPPTQPRASFVGKVSYCPEVFNILDGEGLWDVEVSASFEIAPRATAFVSFTKIEADIEGRGEQTLDKTLRVGLTLGF